MNRRRRRPLQGAGGAPKIRLYAFHVEFARYLADSFHFQLSVGFQGLIAALLSCKTVDVYGFAAGPSEAGCGVQAELCSTHELGKAYGFNLKKELLLKK